MTDDEIKNIARQTAAANHISITNITVAPMVDSAGDAAIEIIYSIPHGSSANIKGSQSARTTSEVIRQLADAGEERFPIVRYVGSTP
jgi:hypothetical protein